MFLDHCDPAHEGGGHGNFTSKNPVTRFVPEVEAVAAPVLSPQFLSAEGLWTGCLPQDRPLLACLKASSYIYLELEPPKPLRPLNIVVVQMLPLPRAHYVENVVGGHDREAM
jgi:hypothetical protein